MSAPLPPVLADAVRGMTGTRRFVGLAVLAGALALLWVASRWATRPTYVTLYKDLELGAAGEVTAALQKANIPFELASGGSEVLVPVSQQAQARVQLAQQGLPTSGTPGWRLFDETPLGETEARERVRYRRALEGELSKQVSEMRGVQKAVVRLTPPETSPLRRLERPAKASVMLRLRPGAALGAADVQGIAYLVANSVEQLTVENVAIMDDAGRLLSTPMEPGNAFGLSSRQQDLRKAVEGDLSGKVQAMLASRFTPTQARVQVTADLDFDQVEKTIESFDPDRQVLQTEQREEATPDPESGGNRTVIRNDYQNSRETQRVIGAVGAIRRLNVAVLLDANALPADTAQGGRALALQLAKLDSLARSAVGYDSTRGDRLTLVAMPFLPDSVAAAALGTTAPAEAPATPSALDLAERFSRPAILLLGIICAFILGLRLLKPAPARAATAAGAALAAAGAPAAMPPAPELPALPEMPPSVSNLLRQKVQAESASQPTTAAQVIRAWMAES